MKRRSPINRSFHVDRAAVLRVEQAPRKTPVLFEVATDAPTIIPGVITRGKDFDPTCAHCALLGHTHTQR